MTPTIQSIARDSGAFQFKVTLVALSFIVVAMTVLGTRSATASDHKTSSAAGVEAIEAAVLNPARRDSHKARDQYRHPKGTLEFFGLEPDLTVAEIWPGGQGGYYASIIAPVLAEEGTYIGVSSRSDFPEPVENVPDGSADMVFVFRAHGFIIYDEPFEAYYQAIFRMLKPGGVFGIVDHRDLEDRAADPDSGYVHESYVRRMAEEAGFTLIATSDVNANPKDDRIHPNGVYSLPPTLRGSRGDEAAAAKYRAIGESDRFTLKFIKPE